MSQSLKQIMQRAVAQNAVDFAVGTVKTEPFRRYLSFTILADACLPGFFAEDFELTIGSLTPDDEVRSAGAAKGDAFAMGHQMARRSLVAFNGEGINRADGEDEVLWSALGPTGRGIVLSMFTQLVTPSEDAMGKAQATLRAH